MFDRKITKRAKKVTPQMIYLTWLSFSTVRSLLSEAITSWTLVRASTPWIPKKTISSMPKRTTKLVTIRDLGSLALPPTESKNRMMEIIMKGNHMRVEFEDVVLS